MNKPLVSIVVLAYNHEKFIVDAFESIKKQTYEQLEVVVVDDASIDDTWRLIQENALPTWKLIRNKTNLGNCRSFNQAYVSTRGAYVIDFAADDLMFSDRIEKQVTFFKQQKESIGVIYHNAMYIDEKGDELNNHKNLYPYQPSGHIFNDLLGQYIICAPTMMMKRQVLEDLNGYDENLAFEDFDFWIRSSAISEYAFQDETLTAYRRLKGSLGDAVSDDRIHNIQDTIYQVSLKAEKLIQDSSGSEALKKRVVYEMRQCLFAKNWSLVKAYFEMLKRNKIVDVKARIINVFAVLRLSMVFLKKANK